MLLGCKTASFSLQNLCFYTPKNMVLGRFKGEKRRKNLSKNAQAINNQCYTQP